MLDPYIRQLIAQGRIDDMRRIAAAHQRLSTASRAEFDLSPVTVRLGVPQDADAIETLAKLDSSKPPAQPTLLAEAGGELRAALSLLDGSVIADPFHPTAQLVELLRVRARQLGNCGRRRLRARLRLRRRLVPQPGTYR